MVVVTVTRKVTSTLAKLLCLCKLQLAADFLATLAVIRAFDPVRAPTASETFNNRGACVVRALSALENTECGVVSAARVAEGETADEKSKGIEDFQPRFSRRILRSNLPSLRPCNANYRLKYNIALKFQGTCILNREKRMLRLCSLTDVHSRSSPRN